MLIWSQDQGVHMLLGDGWQRLAVNFACQRISAKPSPPRHKVVGPTWLGDLAILHTKYGLHFFVEMRYESSTSRDPP